MEDFEIEKFLEIVEEAKIKKYPSHILNYDLNKYWDEIIAKYIKVYEKQIDDLQFIINNDKGYEEGYDEGYDDGYSEGAYNTEKKFINSLAEALIDLKTKLKNNSIQGRDLQLALTQILIDLDKNCDLEYTDKEDILNTLDVEDPDEIFSSNRNL